MNIEAKISFSLTATSPDQLEEALRAAVEALIEGGNIDYPKHMGYADDGETSYHYMVDEYTETADDEDDED